MDIRQICTVTSVDRRRRLPVAVVIVVVFLLGACGSDRSAPVASGDTSVTGTTPGTTPAPPNAGVCTTLPPTTSAPGTAAPTTTAEPPTTAAPTTDTPPDTSVPDPTVVPPIETTLRPGDVGEAVVAFQRRLQDLRFWSGPADGTYGLLTEQAVTAFQKANGLAVTGVASPDVQRALAAAVVVPPASGSGTLVEIDKTRQLLIFVRDGATEWVFNTSTGTEAPYRDPDGRIQIADTPPGHHVFVHQFDGTEPGRLGPLYRPKYFHRDGIAIHGYASVPPRPASHGCVRVTFAAMDFIWSAGLAPLGKAVWVYGTSPGSVTPG